MQLEDKDFNWIMSDAENGITFTRTEHWKPVDIEHDMSYIVNFRITKIFNADGFLFMLMADPEGGYALLRIEKGPDGEFSLWSMYLVATDYFRIHRRA